MESILSMIYDQFYDKPKNTPPMRRIAANHRLLIQRLNKQNRKLVLRIIDDKDLICGDVSLDSFIQGFRLGAKLTTEILNESDGVLRGIVE